MSGKSTDVSALSFEDALFRTGTNRPAPSKAASRSWKTPSPPMNAAPPCAVTCEAKLAEAEARVAAIVEHADGTLSTRPVE